MYLVTGWEKTQSWGIATFHSVSDEFQLRFGRTPTAGADLGAQYQWSGNPAQKNSYDPSPINDGPLNQTTFLHGFSIMLGTEIWERQFETVQAGEIVGSPLGRVGGNSMSPTQGSSLLSRAFSFFRGGKSTSGHHHVGWNEHVILSDLSPVPKA
jgi:hypothetical protein